VFAATRFSPSADAGSAISRSIARAAHGRPDALAFNCASYEFGVRQGAVDTVVLVERWTRREDLDALLSAKVIPALPVYNALLKRPFDPSKDTMRIEVTAG